MVRYYVLYDGDDLEAERKIILNEVIKPIRNKVEASGLSFEFEEIYLNIHDEEKETELNEKWLKTVCEDKRNATKPHIVLLLGDKVSANTRKNKNLLKILFTQKIEENIDVTVLVSNTICRVNSYINKKNNEKYKNAFRIILEEWLIEYKRVSKIMYSCANEDFVENDFAFKLYEKSMDYLKKVIKNEATFEILNCFSDEDKNLYEEKKKEKCEFLEKFDLYRSSYYDLILSYAIQFEKFIFENEKSLNFYIERANYTYRHWRKAFSYLKENKKDLCGPMFKNIGKFICKNFDKIEMQKFLYNSTFFKCIAIDYAYSTGENELAEKIIYLGYDRYFEFETLYLMKKYNEKLFYEEIKKLKKICFRRNLYGYYKGYSSHDTYKIYGNEFCEEFYKLAKQMIKEIENSSKNDPRRNEEHIVQNWAK